jgi:hypothetical protein
LPSRDARNDVRCKHKRSHKQRREFEQSVVRQLGLLRTRGATVNPNFHLRGGIGTAERRQRAAVAGIPAPADELIVRNVLEELLKRTATILFRILQLAAKLPWRAADKNHFLFGWREGPPGISGRHVSASEIRGLVTGVAAHSVHTVAILAALDVLQMGMTIVASKGVSPEGWQFWQRGEAKTL